MSAWNCCGNKASSKGVRLTSYWSCPIGVLGLAYCCTGIEDMHPILAINVGATTPLILASIALNAPNLSPPSD